MNSILKTLCSVSLLVTFGIGSSANAAPLIRTSEVSQLEYLAFVKAADSLETFSEWWISHRIEGRDRRDLEERFKNAQEEFLKGDLQAAKEGFTQIFALADQHDWRKEERQVLAFSALRVAQLSTESEQDLWIHRAGRFQEIQIERSLFPPPLMMKFDEAQRLRESLMVNPARTWPEAQFLLIDGQPFELKRLTDLKADKEIHRFTLVYDHAEPESRVMTYGELLQWRPLARELVDGGCNDARWRMRELLPITVQALFKSQCVATISTRPEKRENLSSINPAAGLVQATSPLGTLSGAADLGRSNAWSERTNLSRTWIWIGLGAVAAAVVASQINTSQGGSPSTSVGF